MKSQARAVKPIEMLWSAIAAMRYGAETVLSVSQRPPSQPPTSTPAACKTPSTTAPTAIQATTLARRRRREWSPIGLTVLVTVARPVIVPSVTKGTCAPRGAHATRGGLVLVGGLRIGLAEVGRLGEEP